MLARLIAYFRRPKPAPVDPSLPIEKRLPHPTEWASHDHRTENRITELMRVLNDCAPDDRRIPEWRKELEQLVTEGSSSPVVPGGVEIHADVAVVKGGSV